MDFPLVSNLLPYWPPLFISLNSNLIVEDKTITWATQNFVKVVGHNYFCANDFIATLTITLQSINVIQSDWEEIATMPVSSKQIIYVGDATSDNIQIRIEKNKIYARIPKQCNLLTCGTISFLIE